MSHCIRCGKDIGYRGGRICRGCMDKWLKKRTTAFDQAVKEVGPLSRETHKAITKRVKQLEKE